MSETRVGRASDLFGKVRCDLHPKQARYQASLQPDSGNIFSILAQRVARALPLPGTSPGGRQSALPLPSRYQHSINLLKTHDKLARGRDLMAARLGRLPHRYLFECHGCCGALCVDRGGLENSNKGKEFVWRSEEHTSELQSL